MQMTSNTRLLSVCPVSCPSLSLKRTLRTRLQRKEDTSTAQSFGKKWSALQATSDTASTEMASPAAEEKKDDVVGTVVTPSLVNKPWLRTTVLVGTLLLASAYLQKPLPGQYMRLAHIFAFASWFGSTVWVILLSPKLMLATLGIQTFGELQKKLFPQFFGFSVLSLIVMLGTKPISGIPYALTAGLITSVIQWLVLEPGVSNGTAERYALERAEVRDEDKIALAVKKTRMYHGLSSIVALITVCCAVAHGYALSMLLSF